MKVIVNIPLHATREYLDDFDETSIPNVGDDFGELYGRLYVVNEKTIDKNVCTLDLIRKEFFGRINK